MKLYGKLVKNNTVLKEIKKEKHQENGNFHATMEELFIGLCRDLDVPVPIWLKKNTRELARYRKTFFNREQFIEDVFFDRLVLEMEV
ncbi:MAG: hypothetical protein R6W96_04395 [Clostridia bacterium]